MNKWFDEQGKLIEDVWDGKTAIGSNGGWGTYEAGSYKRCYHDHPALKLPDGSLIYGGSCSKPAVGDADVYIGFDFNMSFSQRSWPWKKGSEFLFEVTDYRAPSDAAEFKKLVAWTIKQLKEGKKVHAGCIGGHGRTGTFLAAIVAEMGEKDAINYVREHYCKKAVESSEQIKFLAKNFGVITKGVAQAKVPAKSTGKKHKGHHSSALFDDGMASARTYSPMRSAATNIWEKR